MVVQDALPNLSDSQETCDEKGKEILKAKKLISQGSDSGPSRENLTWTSEQMDYLIQLLVEQSRIPGMKSGGGLKSKAYTAIEKGMVDKFGSEFTKEKIKNKLKYSKPNLTVMKEILNTSGFGYDPINKCIEVDSQHYPNRKKYRGPKLWRYFDEFAEVFGDSHATGRDSITLNSIIHEDIASVPQTPASQTTPTYMNPETSHSFTQMYNDDPMATSSPPPQSPVPPTPNTENPMTSNRTGSRTKKQRASNYEEYYSLLNGIANNVDTMTRDTIRRNIWLVGKIGMQSEGQILSSPSGSDRRPSPLDEATGIGWWERRHNSSEDQRA
ncbi:hypothetical protein EJ110_NYTH39732 [Nymphaea thermarum]|nr:hypothetical protein EJ110_NYTH39732 [Nymphaea thermarum]